jgi:DNA-binding XRE family transcriptional regulator
MASTFIGSGSHIAYLEASEIVRSLRDDACGYVAQTADMAKNRWYLKEWRKHRGYTQERLADMIGSSKGYISDLERGERRYNQELLEGLAEALMCEPADLLMRDPSQPDGIWSIWDQLKPVEQAQVVEIAKTIKRTGTNG